jgi:20S proteasome alpha/beta subunit
LNFNIIYDASVNSAPAAFKTAITAVAQFFQNNFSNPITITIDVGYGEINGQAMAAGALGESETFFNSSSYAQIHNALASHATSADQISAVNSLPAGDPTGGGNYWVSTAEAKALGLAGASSSIDGYVGFSSTFAFTYNNSGGVAAGTYDFFGVAAHEFTEVMGRSLFVGIDGIGANAYTPLDLFHYSSPGAHDFSGTTPGYFSLNGGATNLDNFNTNPNGDAGDWAGSAGHDSFLAFSSPGVVNAVTQTDLRVMNVLGYTAGAADVTPPAMVNDHALVVGIGKTGIITPSYLAASDSGNGDAQLTYTIVTGPSFGTLLKSGFATFSFTQADIDNGLITYRENGSNVPFDSFTFKVSDPAGNHTATQSFQFQIFPVTVVEARGSTSLTQVSNQFDLYNSGGSGPVLNVGGAPFVAGQSGAWTPIGAEQTAGGYEIAWKIAGADQYTVGNADNGGNYIGNVIGVVSGASTTLEAFEPSFQQDLNGDGLIGPPTTVIEASGSTHLTEVGNQYFLFGSGGTGPVLQVSGAPFVAGGSGSWVPIGAEPAAGGYEIAWKIAGADQYTVGNADSSGNYLTNVIGVVSGASTTLEAFELSFQQDLNGDGFTGVVGSGGGLIEASGSTHLTEVGNQFFLYDIGGSGPVLKVNGAAVVDGQFGAWTPIGAEQSGSGYEVAWKMAGADQYTVWTTDAGGNYISNDGTVSGASLALKAIEPGFQQDLNGDGVIGGAATTLVEGAGSTRLTQVGNQFYLFDGGGFGPALKVNGAAVVAGQFGAWAPIGAEQSGAGYEVAWKMAGADQYTVWTTDGSGNYISTGGTVSAANRALEALEPSFQQDLNGDGVIGTGPGSLSSASLPVGTGDFNGDGNPDMLWLNADDTLTIHEMNGSSVIGAADLPAPPPSWHLVGTGDLNGDGKSDILWQNSGGEVGIWEMNGTSIASAVSPGNPGAAWEFQGASDVDGDGKDDLLFMNPITNQTQTWLMNGTQVTAMQAPLAAPQSSGPVLSETEFYLPAESATGMAGDISPIRTSTLPDAGTAGLLLTRT